MLQLPKLEPISVQKKKTILLLSDDLNAPSGIGTMSREIVFKTVKEFNWIQLAASIQHPDAGKILDMSEFVSKETGVNDASVILYPYSGYGDANILRHILTNHRVDGIVHFTDPRYWTWLYAMEHEIRSVFKIPLMYYSIWDDLPYPHWNYAAYSSCDLLMAINKQTHLIHKRVLEQGGSVAMDIDSVNVDGLKDDNATLCSYIPHGIDHEVYKPITEDPEYLSFVERFKTINNCEFVVFWNNRNIRRKQPGDVILSFKLFRDMLPDDQKDKVVLLMHTHPRDHNGTDLIAIHENIAPDCKVRFSVDRVEPRLMNYYYNLADVTLNIASNEGFGLSNAESIMAGTPVIANVTGGLQDQMAFRDDNDAPYEPTDECPSNHGGKYILCGKWAHPVFPSNRSLQGSLETPYIFDDRAAPEDIAKRIYQVYLQPREERKNAGIEGRNWMINSANMTANKMGDLIIRSVNICLQAFKPKNKFLFFKVKDRLKNTNPGISKI